MPTWRREHYVQIVLLKIQVSRVLAVLAVGSAALPAFPSSASAATSGPNTRPRSVSTAPATAASSGTLAGLTGVVTDSHGHRLAGVCVTASPRAASGGRTVVTSAGGLFLITGLRAGQYLLHYRDCLAQPGRATSAAKAALGSGPLVAPLAAAREYVTPGHVVELGLVTLRSRASAPAAARPMVPAVRLITAAQLRHRVSGQHLGGIAGRVVGQNGKPIKGLCVFASIGDLTIGRDIGPNGRYSFGKFLPTGKYKVSFSAACGGPFNAASANWAPEWYRGHLNESAANPVVVKAGVITRGIDAVMRPGGVITGTVTGPTGRGLAGMCVVLVSANGAGVQQVTTPRNGRYRFQGLDPGRYGVGFFPDCGPGLGGYLPQWWPDTTKLTKHGLIKTGIGTIRAHVDAKMVLGGTISGLVRSGNRNGRPLKGICVDATPTGQPNGNDFLASTNADGKYSIRGLTAGRYALNFSPGCNNNGNYLSQNYPHSVTVRLSRVTSGINAYLQPGGIIAGTVTAKSDGARLSGICVATSDGYSMAETGANGTYAINQLSPGKNQLEFFNCSSHGNFAPQFYPDQLDPTKAVSISVRSGQVVKGINAAMAPGATISGTITLASGTKPSNVCVEADPVTGFGNLGGGLTATRHGEYAIEDQPPGTYQVQYISCGGPNIGDAWFSDPGHVTQDETRADQIYLPLGGVVSGVNAEVRLGGSISGWIYGPAKHQGAFVCELITDAHTGQVASEDFAVQVGEGFTIFGFAPGRYLVEFIPCSGPSLAPQWYDRASRPALATPVLVRPGHTTQNVNAHLTSGGSITGQVVSKLSGKPLAGVCVEASGVNQPTIGFGGSNRSGKYVVNGLNDGSYRLTFFSCDPTGLIPLRSGVVRVAEGKMTAGPKVAVVPVREGAISGRVKVTGSPPGLVTNACVDAFSIGRGALGAFEDQSDVTGTRGRYQITGLVPGKYKVFLGDLNCATDPGGLAPQWFGGTSQVSKATAVTVAAGRTTQSISATLQRDGSISGTVTGPSPALGPLAGVCVQVEPAGSEATRYLTESAGRSGRYRTGPLPPGRYLVEFESGCGAAGFATQWWRGAASMKAARPVTVRAGRSTTGISAIG
jgi:Carboxypeptidase regulatory-like domain